MRALGTIAVLAVLVGCHSQPGIAKGHKPPDFTMTDGNPASPSFGEARTLSAMEGTVVALYFASFT